MLELLSVTFSGELIMSRHQPVACFLTDFRMCMRSDMKTQSDSVTFSSKFPQLLSPFPSTRTHIHKISTTKQQKQLARETK